jgi:hypothetical protein
MKSFRQELVLISEIVFLVALLTVLCSLWAVAAETTATISGAVKDSSGAAIAKAPITLTNTATNISKTVQSGDDGSYLFTLVPIGTYRLSVEQPGFRKYIREGIVLNVNQNAKLDIALQVGATTEVVNVTGDVTQVDTLSATLGSVETTRRILDLPLVERDTFQLGLLQAGVFPPDDDDGSNNPFSVSGQRSESLSFLINGTDNNDFLNNNSVVDPNPDAVAEFKILTNNYEAEFGRTSGGIVNQVIKSGTNAVHGDLFEFFRNDALNARNYFLPNVTPFKRNTFGGTLGGPIKKDKTFFFVAYQGVRKHEGQVAPVLQVLSPAERTGNFSELLSPSSPSTSPCASPGLGDPTFEAGQLFDPTSGTAFTCADKSTVTLQTPYPNNQVPVNPVIKNYIAKYLPLPNLPNNQFVSSPVAVLNDDQGIVRIDHHFGQNDTIYGSYIIDDFRQSYPFRVINGATSGGNVPVGSGFDEPYRTQLGTFSWLHNFSPTVVNEFIFGANRRASLNGVPHDRTPPSALGFTNVNPDDPAGAAPPIMITTTFNLGPNPQGPTTLHDVTFHWQDSVSMTRGRHNIKFGTDIRRVRNNFHFDFDNNGVFDFGNFLSPFTGSTLADFVGGFYDNYSQFSKANYGIRTTSWHFFGQDSWRVLPRLTLSYGMRYEYNTPLEDPSKEILGFFPGQRSTRFPGAPTGILYPGDPGTPNSGVTYPDRNNFAPRFGFAWDMLGNAKLVMRGGFGIFYDLEDGALNEQFGGEAPFGFVTNLNPGGYTNLGGIDPIADPFTAFSASPNPYPSGGKPLSFGVPKISFAYVADPHFRTPYSENINYGLQYQLTKDTMVEADYVGSLSRKSIVSADVNPPLPSILKQQYANAGFTFADCARALAGCSDPTNPNDLNSFPTQAAQLITDLSAGSSDSHQFQLTVDKRFSQGFNIRGAYTLAKTIDTQSGFRYNASLFTDPFNFRFDRGLANFDVTHRVVISGIWELPLDRPFRNRNGLMQKITEGWEASGIASFQTGTPFTIFSNANSSQEATGFDRADLVGATHTFDSRTLRSFDSTTATCLGQTTPVPGAHFYFDPTAYDCANVPLFTFGNSGRNSVRGPGRNNFDLTIGRTFKFGESKSVEFRSEFFNAFNHAQFMNPDHSGGSSTFAQITQARDPRIIQLALKFYF